MYHFRVILPLLVAVLALEIALTASQVLPSSSTPLTAAYTEELDIYLVVQEDGTATFSDQSGTYSVVLPSNYRGESYHVLSGDSSRADVAVINSSHIFTIRCKPQLNSCSPLKSAVSLPFTPSNRKSLAMRTFHSDPAVVAIATADTIVTFNLANMRVISNITWAFKNHYTLNHASGMRYSGTGDDYYIVAMANKDNPGDPGVVIRIACDANGHLYRNTPLVITYMTVAPMNFVVSSGYPSVRYWSQTDTKTGRAYINSFDSYYSQGPVSPYTKSGQVISPSLVGEYPMTQVGAMAVGNIHVMGWSRVCLHFGYGMSEGPEVSITEQRTYSTKTGLPFLGFQLGELVPSIIAVAKTASGWELIGVHFGDCPMPMMVKKREDSQKSTPSTLHSKPNNPFPLKSATNGASTTNAERNTQHKSDSNRTAKPNLPSLAFPFSKNCQPSSCSIDDTADCPEQCCWSIASTGRFMCCLQPPI